MSNLVKTRPDFSKLQTRSNFTNFQVTSKIHFLPLNMLKIVGKSSIITIKCLNSALRNEWMKHEIHTHWLVIEAASLSWLTAAEFWEARVLLSSAESWSDDGQERLPISVSVNEVCKRKAPKFGFGGLTALQKASERPAGWQKLSKNSKIFANFQEN